MKKQFTSMTKVIGMIIFILTATLSKAATKIWTNGGGDNLWSNSSNWSGGSPGTGDVAQFDGTSGANCTMDVSPAIQGLNVTSAYTGSISQGSSTLNLSVSLTINNSAQYNAGTGLVIFNGTITANCAASLYNLEIKGNGNILFNQNAVVNNTLTITSVNIMYGNYQIQVSGNVVINDAWNLAGSICTISLRGSTDQSISGNGDASYLDISKTGGNVILTDDLGLSNGTLSGSGLLKNSGGKVKVNGTQILAFTGTMDDLEVAGNGVVAFYQDAIVNNSLTITSVNIMYGDKQIKVSGNVVINDAWNLSGSICTISLRGSNDQSISGNGDASYLDISKTGGNVLLTDDLGLSNGTLSGSGLLKNSGGKVKVNGTQILAFTGTMDDLEVAGNGVVAFYQDAIVNNSLTITSVNIMYGDKQIKVSGNVVINDAWNLSGSICTISLRGSTDQSISGNGDASYLDISKTGGNVLLTDDLGLNNGTLSGSGLLKNSGGKVKVNGNYILAFTGTMDDLEVAGNGVVAFYQDAIVNNSLTITSVHIMYGDKQIKVSGNVVINDAWNLSGSICTISLRGSSDQSISGTGDASYLDISKSGGNVLLTDDLGLSNGTLSGSGLLKNSGGKVKVNGNYILDFTGTMDDLEMAGNGVVAFYQNAVVNNSLTITSVNIMYGDKQIQVSGNVVVNDSWNGSGSICTISLRGTSDQTLSGSAQASYMEFAKPSGNWIISTSFTNFTQVTVTNGTWDLLSSSTTASSGYFLSGGKIGGTGTLNGNVYANSGGGIFPGSSAGCLTINGNLTMNSGSTYNVEINGSTACSEHDQISVNGTVTLNSPTLTGGNGSPSSAITIIQNDASDNISGTFSGMANNATINLGGTQYVIKYNTPSGNDITLTALCSAPSTPTISTSSSSNCGAQSTTLSISTGTLNSATSWKWYSGSCGGTSAGSGTSISVSPSVTTTYYARGEGGCVTPGSCANITIMVIQPTSPDVPTLSASSSSICGNQSSTLSITGGSLNGASNWQWYSASCAGTAAGTGTSITVAPTATTTYYARGEGGCITLGSCANTTVTVTGPSVPTGANVYSGNITINTQTQMDAFFNNSNGEKYTKISGLLTLNGNHYNDPITSLCNLSSLVEITGNLNINNFNKSANPSSLSQLAALTTLGCGLNISSNSLLQDATLPNLSSIGCSVNISDNGALRILNMPLLGSVQGGQFTIKNNPKLELASASTTASSFSFTGKGSNVEISDNGSTSAQNLSMNFKKMTYLNGTLTFNNNDNAGVSNFDDIFTGLNNMSVKWGKITITNNDYLNTCCIAASVIINGSGKRHIISGNTGNCVDSATVLANCGSFHKKSTSQAGLTNAFVEYNVYPNPSSGIFNLDVMSNEIGQLNISITDLMGRTILTESHVISQFTSLPISLTSVASGTYFLKAEMNGEVFVKRIVLNK